MPGLIVSVCFVGLILGPLVSDLPLRDFMADPDTASFLWRNIAMIRPQYDLPGVFGANPYPTVQGSIWTLFYEVACYGIVLVLGVAGLLRHRCLMLMVFAGYVLIWAAAVANDDILHPTFAHLRDLSLPFMIGVAFWVWRDSITLSCPILAGLIMIACLTHGTMLFDPALMLALAHATFWLAYVPAGRIRQFNGLGDYSYGIYIYAFAIQGWVMWYWGAMSPVMNIAISVIPTLICAILSWHLIERPALGWARALRLPQKPRYRIDATAPTQD